ncbi:helix-turn-helix domain containing protein [Modestobacter sp. SSW1-42]|uniref:helix-turn-helix domain containing protein n=1 Tax=Modestobacter sp. SSW1-42 TaxID=596372 RepID=UPI003986BB92
MPYPPRPQLRPLPEFAGTRDAAHPLLQVRLETFIVASYRDGRSLREIAELVDRSQTAVRKALDKHQVPRRPAGARPVADQ